jgi:hypothetical protein
MTIVPVKAGPFVSHFLLFFLLSSPTPVSLRRHGHGRGRAGRSPAAAPIAMAVAAPVNLPPSCSSIRPSSCSRCRAHRHGRASSRPSYHCCACRAPATATATMAPRRADQAPTAALIEPVEFLLPRPPPLPRVEPTEFPSPRPSSTDEPSCSSYHHKLLVNPNIARYPLEISRDSTQNYSRMCYR